MNDDLYDREFLKSGRLPVLLVTVAVFGLVQAWWLPTNSDVAWYLYTAGRVIDGARLYIDVVDTNPPLIVCLSMAVEAIARLIGISSLILYPLCVFALIAVSLILCWRLRTALPLALRQTTILVMAYLLLVHVGGMFGQREHLMLILILPYAYTVAIGACGGETSRSLSLATGVMAGIGFALKPFFVPSLMALELYLAYRRGVRIWIRPQALAIVAVFAFYLVALPVFTPQYIRFAWAASSIFGAYHPYGDLPLARSWRFAGVLFAVVSARAIIRRHAPPLTDVLSLLALTLTLAVFLQGKGFLYHWYPAGAAAGLHFGMIATGVFLRFNPKLRWVRPETVLAFLVPLLCVHTFMFWSMSLRRPADLEDLVRTHAKGDAILALSSYIDAGFPLVNVMDVGWASRHPMLWQIPGFYQSRGWVAGRYHTLGEMTDLERDFLHNVVTDMERGRPALLFVDRVPPTPDMAGFDYLEYLAQEARFARLFARYEFLRDAGHYRIFKRSDSRRGCPVRGDCREGTGPDFNL